MAAAAGGAGLRSFAEFAAMSGYGEFVWSAFGFTLLVLAINAVAALRRLRKAKAMSSSMDEE